jgi:hypothetical protein
MGAVKKGGEYMLRARQQRLMFLPILLFALTLSATSFLPTSYAANVSAAFTTQTRDTPTFNAYKGVSIGMTIDEVRARMGNPKEPSESMDYYAPSDNEFIQIYYEAKKVTAVTVTFSGKLDAAPDAKTVFGELPEVKPDGGIFKMVRYPKAGYWISYNKITGSDPMIMIAIKKI